jgi:Putative transposase
MDAAVATASDPLLDNEPELARTMAASVTQRIAFGERAGEKVRRIGSGFGDEGERPALTGPRCASVHGFSLHANTEIPAHRRDQLERLIRYTARGAVSLERLTEDDNGDLVYMFTRPWSEAPRVSSCHRWNFWKSWPQSCPCHVSTSCATAAV